MKTLRLLLVVVFVLGIGLAAMGDSSLKEQNEALFAQIQLVHGLTDEQMQTIRAIFSKSGYIGQGNPAITEHPATPSECEEKLSRLKVHYESSEFERTCGANYMAPLYNPALEKAENAKVCIDQFEFPDIPCAYPVVWVRAREAAEICSAMGKRICDAHEWEGACAGSLEPPDYRFDLARGVSPDEAIRRMRAAHNNVYEKSKTWSYGPEYRKGVCGSASMKTAGCPGGSWTKCGSNTYPLNKRPMHPRPVKRLLRFFGGRWAD
jgi:hypothetical protein